TALGGGAGYPGLYGGGLSPFLNLRSGNFGNPAVNYYNFVRPYTGGTFGNTFSPGPAVTGAGRPPFFPHQAPVYSSDDDAPARQKLRDPDEKGVVRVDMPPAGHPSGFMNTHGYFGSANGMQGLGMPRPATQPRRR